MILYDMSFEGLLQKMQLDSLKPGPQNKCSGNPSIDIPQMNIPHQLALEIQMLGIFERRDHHFERVIT